MTDEKKAPLPDVPPALQEAMEAAEETPAEKARRIEEEAKPKKDKLDEAERLKMTEREYEFDFEYKSPRSGEVWSGKFIHTMPSVKTRRLMGVMRAEYTGGHPWESLDPMSQEIISLTTYLAFTVQSLNPEGHWSEDFDKIDDYEVLQALWGRCMAHEATFLRHQVPPRGGA